jgi:hypothetical protein
VTFRCLTPGDAPLLASDFRGLSAASRAFFGPHPLDDEAAARVCAEGDPCTQRIVGVADGAIIASRARREDAAVRRRTASTSDAAIGRTDRRSVDMPIRDTGGPPHRARPHAGPGVGARRPWRTRLARLPHRRRN